MNIVNIIKYVLIGLCVQSITEVTPMYAYDKFQNRDIRVDISDTRPYYTSDIFHSIEYSCKNTNNKKLKLRTFYLNTTKSLPNISL
jgi:hypothetical protein